MKNKISFIALVIFLMTAFFFKLYRHTFYSIENYGVVDWDNFGYYLYLPSFFIYDDIELKNDERINQLIDQYNLFTGYYQAHPLRNGNRVIQYTSGMALIYSPAFFMGHLWALISDQHAADGFSLPYQTSLLIELYLILFLGLLYLRKLCLGFFNDKITAILILLLCFGTNIFALASIDPASPHTVLFSAYCILLYFTYRWHQKPKFKYLILIAVILALSALSRPNELLFLVIPLFWLGGQFSTLKSKLAYLLKNPAQLLGAMVPFALLGLLQLSYWKHVTGDWIYDSYLNEDFKLLDPYLKEYLFSFKKGWLLYTPLMLFAVIGFYPFFKQKRQLAIVFLLFVLSNIWILSSWDCWWYAASFSQRSIAQSYPVFALPLGYLLLSLKNSRPVVKYSLSSIIALSFVLNLFQTYQFRKGILHAHRMTQEYYFASFFNLSLDKEKQKLLEPNRDVVEIPEHEVLNESLIFAESYSTLNQQKDTVGNYTFPAEGNLVLNKELPYSKAFSFPFNQYSDTSYAYFRAMVRFRSEYTAEESKFGIVALSRDYRSGKNYKYVFKSSKEVKDYKIGEWRNLELLYCTPYLRNKKDSLFFFLHLTGEKPIEVDQFYLKLYDPSKKPGANQTTYFTDYRYVKDSTWGEPKTLIGEKPYEYIDSSKMYSSTLKLAATKIRYNQLNFEVTGLTLDQENDETYAVVSIKNKKEEQIYYQPKRLNNHAIWESQNFLYTLPDKLSESDTLYTYLWSKSTPYLIRSMHLKTDLN